MLYIYHPNDLNDLLNTIIKTYVCTFTQDVNKMGQLGCSELLLITDFTFKKMFSNNCSFIQMCLRSLVGLRHEMNFKAAQQKKMWECLAEPNISQME